MGRRFLDSVRAFCLFGGLAIAQVATPDEPIPPRSRPTKAGRSPRRCTISVRRGSRGSRESARRSAAGCCEILRVKPGQTVCDMGCGNGFYTIKLAKMVGEKGKVVAVDIQPEMLDLLEGAGQGRRDQEYRAGAGNADRSEAARKVDRPDAARGRVPRVFAPRAHAAGDPDAA